MKEKDLLDQGVHPSNRVVMTSSISYRSSFRPNFSWWNSGRSWNSSWS